ADWLYLIDLDPNNWGEIRGKAHLWEGSLYQPILAAGPRGNTLGVAGNKDHKVLVYSVRSILNNAGQAQKQELRSVGATVASVAPVRKGRNPGLLLSSVPKKGPGVPARDSADGDLVFDFAERKLTSDLNGWRRDAVDLAGWRVQLTGNDGRAAPRLVVSLDDEVQGETRLKERFVVTDYALLPPQRGVSADAVLAIAYLDQNTQPALGLYNAKTGERFRQLTGHV